MPVWEQPPRCPWDLLKEYVEIAYPGTSMACDATFRCTYVGNDAMEQDAFDAMLADLKEKFPGAF